MSAWRHQSACESCFDCFTFFLFRIEASLQITKHLSIPPKKESLKNYRFFPDFPMVWSVALIPATKTDSPMHSPQTDRTCHSGDVLFSFVFSLDLIRIPTHHAFPGQGLNNKEKKEEESSACRLHPFPFLFPFLHIIIECAAHCCCCGVRWISRSQ